MRINNNIMALNAHRQLGMNQASSAKSMEKLSSGFRINRAGDDAAGLAISEKMRGQIRGLKQASRNAQDGISLIQTAEGALNETHSILQRMRELAVQSATDTNTNKDRAEIQKEIDQLSTEVTRISGDTQFNTMKLLSGEFSSKVLHIGANDGQSVTLGIGKMDAEALDVVGVLGAQTTLADSGHTSNLKNVKVQNTTITGFNITYTTVANNNTAVASTTARFTQGNLEVSLARAAGTASSIGAITATIGDVVSALERSGLKVEVDGVESNAVVTAAGPASRAVAAGTVDTNAGLNVSSQYAADKAIDVIDKAILDVSGERSKLGAMQNRLEHTIANLGTSAENLQAAESRIRDLDMADEIMAFTKNSILQQAATAMLAQANMAPQSVLQLLG